MHAPLAIGDRVFIYDAQLHASVTGTVAELHAQGRYVIVNGDNGLCYGRDHNDVELIGELQ